MINWHLFLPQMHLGNSSLSSQHHSILWSPYLLLYADNFWSAYSHIRFKSLGSDHPDSLGLFISGGGFGIRKNENRSRLGTARVGNVPKSNCQERTVAHHLFGLNGRPATSNSSIHQHLAYFHETRPITDAWSSSYPSSHCTCASEREQTILQVWNRTYLVGTCFNVPIRNTRAG